ncbi:DUF58 domain-containing protein [Sulfurihydrogenibium sp.]|uniref:DUF58 domain-containing protein n=1 Tax=Sulfurihydrogenibium sp. TaxID=2053621 RepID=UPI0026059EA3|nr:DUF58 domain-containing protein [Sulfurihydrogenibium sp.]
MDSRKYSYPSVIKITKAGWIYILTTVFIGFAAVNTNNNLLFFIVSAFLSFMGLSGFFGKRNIENLQIDLDFPEEIFSNREFVLKVKLKNNKKFLSSFLIEVILEDKSVLFPVVDTEDEKNINFLVSKRGLLEINSVKICSVFPFNFFIRCKTLKVDYKKFVYPEPKKYPLYFTYSELSKKKGETTSENIGYEGDFLGVRDYTLTTPIKYIDWKSSAKSEKLKEKVFSALQSQPVIVEFEKINLTLEEKLSFLTYITINYKQFENTFIKFENHVYNINLKSEREKLLSKFATYGMMKI